MTQLGMGVMLRTLFGSRDPVDLTKVIGKVIESVELVKGEVLSITVEGGTKINLVDDGQSCCENRYMTTDDDLPYYVGATLVDVELADAPNQDDVVEEHDVQFLHVKTSKGVFTIENHNEHNGYYGGFAIAISVIDAERAEPDPSP